MSILAICIVLLITCRLLIFGLTKYMRKFYGFIISVVLLQLATLTSYGQYYFKHYQVDDGLVHNSVSAILQDSRGLMWIGTRGGLTRFDGYTFKTYLNKQNRFGALGNNVITAIAEDNTGMLWIATGKGLFKYNPFTEVFTQLENVPKAYTSHLVIDDKDNLWFLSNYILYNYNQQTKKAQSLKQQASCIAVDHQLQLWVGNDDGLIKRYNIKTNKTTTAHTINQAAPDNKRSISKIFPVNDTLALIGCFKQGLMRYNPKTGQTVSLPLQKESADIYVRDITPGGNHQYWIATESGVYIYDLITGKSQHLKKKAGDPYSLSDNAVYAICHDNSGGMWVGTFFGGLNYFSTENSRFDKYYLTQGPNSISGDAIGSICADKYGKLWIGTEDAGINKFDPQTGKFTNYTANGQKGDISYPNIHGLLAVDNQLFIGPFLHGLEIMDIRTGKVTERFKLVGDKPENFSDFVLRIYLTKDSTLLLGAAYHGASLFSYSRNNKTFTPIKQIPLNSYAFDIAEDSKGNIWTGSVSNGAYFYNPKTGKSGNLRFGDAVKNEIINEFAVRNIFEDSNHTLWFTTAGGGLVRLSPDHKTVKKFTTTDGLPSNFLFCILEDNAKHLWISSLKGLICFDLRTLQCKTYTKANGLITDQFNYNSAFKTADGKMYFGSVKGLIAFRPEEFFQKATHSPTYITGFQINNQEIAPGKTNGPLKKSILFTDSIVLEHDQNNFSIEFAALNYSSAKVTRYRYFMKGLDKDWTYLNTNRNAFFTDLAPGVYTFTVRAESNVGSWTSNERRLYIKILPPFWKSQAAYLIYSILFILAIYFSIRYYHRYVDRKNQNKLRLFESEKEKEIYQFKIDFFTNIAHEIQTPLTLIMGPIERLLKKAEEHPNMKKGLLMAQKHVTRLTELTSQLLDFRQTEMEQFGLNFVNIDINQLLKEQIEPFKDMARTNGINLRLELPKNRVVAFVDRDALIKICSNLISNGIKYGTSQAGVTLEPLNAEDEYFIIRFSNDGKGIADEFRKKIFEPFYRLNNKEKPGTGIGLPLAKSLTELHNGSLTLQSGEANNIVFVVKLPVRQAFEFNLGSWKKLS